MSFERPGRLTQVVVWFGVVGGPLAFAGFHIVGVGSADTACAPAGVRWGVDPKVWSAALTISCGAVAAAAIVTAVLVWRRTRIGDTDAAPPVGRIHFLATIGIVVGLLCLFIILMAGLGSTVIGRCVQS